MRNDLALLNDPALLEEATESVLKIQKQGYVFCLDIATEKFQACHQDGTVEYEFDNWQQIIAFADNIHDERNK